MSNSLLIRSATISDSPRIAALHVASWRLAYRGALSDEYLAGDVESDRRQLWERRLTNPAHNQHILLMEDGPQLIGFSCVYADEEPRWGSYLNNIHVAQSHQGKGMGGRLLKATALTASRSKAKGLFLWVLQSNLKAQGFYARFGARNTGISNWDAPGGTVAPLFRYSWEDVSPLQAARRAQ